MQWEKIAGVENAGVENAIWEKIAGVETAGVENAGADRRGGKCRSKPYGQPTLE